MQTAHSISTSQAGALLLGGAGIGLLAVLLSPDRAMGGWYLHPGLLIPPLMLLSVTLCMLQRSPDWRHFWLSTGALCTVAPHLSVRPGMGRVELAFFDSANLQTTLLVGGSLAILGLLVKRFSQERDPPGPPLESRLLPLAWALVLVFYLVYRLSHHLVMHIPNEERSLMIRGVEVHHLNLGLISLVLSGYLRVWGMGRLQWPGMLLFGGGAALYLDESVYICLAEVSDAAYAGPASTWGGALAIALWMLASQVVRRWKN